MFGSSRGDGRDRGDWWSRLEGLRPLDAGSLNQAAAIEAFTAVCITLNIRHKAHSTLRMGGI